MDIYEQNTFDEWLDENVKKEMLLQLEARWQHLTNNSAIFISATEKWNIDGLRKTILDKVKYLYEERYPYLTQFY